MKISVPISTVTSIVISTALLAALMGLAACTSTAPAVAVNESQSITVSADHRITDARYRSIEIQGIDIAYREAGTPTNPTIVLLHGFPTSSHMFRDLIPQLADRYHVIAPDYPGFGASAMPARGSFEYSFDNFANLTDALLQAKGISNYALYLMDYGAPIGFRLFAKHPERVTGFVIQNGNAYDEGLREFWNPIKAYWTEPSSKNRETLRGALLTLDATKWQWTHGVPEQQAELISPDNWFRDQFLLDRPGSKDIQLDLFLDYGTNVGQYPTWQRLFREHQPPTLIVWGKGDYIFPADGAHPYERDLQTVEKHILDTGHFALETHVDFIAERIRAFMARTTS